METTFDVDGNMITTAIETARMLPSSFLVNHRSDSNRSLHLLGIPLPGLAAHIRCKSNTDIPLHIAANANKKNEVAMSGTISSDLLNQLLASSSTISEGLGNVSTSTINRLGIEKPMCMADTLPALAEVREEGS
ncbi:hypothetical protein WUBG_07774 [Wuchereria bancrofti]|uniref:Uncharacterized protein n=1 Tax=Wuchereria bancrofti TaxID=6293 RepID=J9F1U0_WUCBA|nr:hypothetical protein WUBG_07774 [Wuchereria bancrofti]